MKKVTPKKIRDALIIEQATNGRGISAIADELDIAQSTVYRVLESDEGQIKLKETLTNLESSINARLPRLLDLSLDRLESILTPGGFASRSDMLRAAQIVLQTGLKLSEISARSSQN